MTDEQAKACWQEACRLWTRGSRYGLCRRVALMYCDDLEKAGYTEADVDRWFPPTPIQIWLRDEFVDPSA